MARNVFVSPFGNVHVAVTLRASEDTPLLVIGELLYDVGFWLGRSRATYGKPDRPDAFLAQPRADSVLLTALDKWDAVERASGAVLTQPRIVDKEVYKTRMSFYFGWAVGNKLNVEAALFQRVMGRPAHTQTTQMGSEVSTLWYYDCEDGTIQLVADARLLANGGQLQATVNDY